MSEHTRPSNPRRYPLRAAAAAVAAVVLSFVPQTGASAQESLNLIANQGNWFWSSNNKITVCQANPAPAGPPGACGPVSVSGGVFSNASGAASPISTGHVAVSAKDGASDMRAYLQFDLSTIPLGSTVSSFIMTLTVSNPDQAHNQEHADRSLDTPATLNQNNAAIKACAAAEPWGAAAGGDGGDAPYGTSIPDASQVDPSKPDKNVTTVKNEPTADCGVSILGIKSADGSTWRFDLTRMAQMWVGGQLFNNGLALLPEMRGNAPTWQVEFHGPVTKRRDSENNVRIIVDAKQAAMASVEFEPGEAPTPEPVFTQPPPPPVAGGDVPIPSFGNPDATEQPPPPAEPVGGGTVVPVASTGTTPWYAWALLPLGVLGFGLVSTAVGADGSVAATASNRVAGVLRARRLASEGPDEPVADRPDATDG